MERWSGEWTQHRLERGSVYLLTDWMKEGNQGWTPEIRARRQEAWGRHGHETGHATPMGAERDGKTGQSEGHRDPGESESGEAAGRWVRRGGGWRKHRYLYCGKRGEGRAAMKRSFGQKEKRSRAKSDTSFQIDRSKQDRYAEFLTANGNLRMFPKA